nr:restriction endonuclease subunit S [Methanobrevibacter smithii]
MSLILNDVAKFMTSKIEVSEINESNYVSTENMLSNKGGITIASSLPDAKSVRKYLPQDILINNIRPYFKKIWYSDMIGGCSNDVFVIRSKENYDSKFLYYVLSSDDFFSYVMANAKGTKMPRGDKKAIQNYEVPNFSIDEQKRIFFVLSEIDKKIEVNKMINKNLEEQIETIYNSFFVYYDDFSKEELEECEIGLIPKDWKLMSLGEVTTKIKEKVGSDDYKVFSAVNTGNLILSEEYFDKQVYSKNIEKYIVVKQKEFAYNPARINIGSIGRNDFNYDGCVSPVYVAFKVEEGYENFMNMYIKSNRFNQWVVTLSSGSVRQTLNYADFSIIKIAYPPKDLVNKFNKVYDNYYEVINYNNSVISNLENIRDTLLPKLMSGEIDVSKINCDLE